MIKRKIEISVWGETEAAVEDAFNEAVERLTAGNISGSDHNDESGFYFTNMDELDVVMDTKSCP